MVDCRGRRRTTVTLRRDHSCGLFRRSNTEANDRRADPLMVALLFQFRLSHVGGVGRQIGRCERRSTTWDHQPSRSCNRV